MHPWKICLLALALGTIWSDSLSAQATRPAQFQQQFQPINIPPLIFPQQRLTPLTFRPQVIPPVQFRPLQFPSQFNSTLVPRTVEHVRTVVGTTPTSPQSTDSAPAPVVRIADRASRIAASQTEEISTRAGTIANRISSRDSHISRIASEPRGPVPSRTDTRLAADAFHADRRR